MTSITILGAGAFGTALAVMYALGGHDVTLWSHKADEADRLQTTRKNALRLPDVSFPPSMAVAAEIPAVVGPVLLACPMQALAGLLETHRRTLDGQSLVACCKGIDTRTAETATEIIRRLCPNATPAVLTGPSFATEIARGLPTALTLASSDAGAARVLQQQLSTRTLRLYRTTDTIGAELGGALKNVVAIATGAAIGAEYGESARAAILTRGFDEMTRLAVALGAERETLTGLCGLGDLTLTAMSEQSRNTRFGIALGRGQTFDESTTVEGRHTAEAALRLAADHALDLPVMQATADLAAGRATASEITDRLLARPLKEE
ncbi:NAD(P)H-dependent glycerol-3-phosphate dehydrogenase [Aestuariibius sp. 2305UL40-4]|uniref:NAD(P)H-dependent glycerol-3-phosphate dehydrogenase n=1 Tax=Aestuariibius violaceus TaxID=3234132 RepID=UPI00345E98E1